MTGHTGFKGAWLCAWLEMLGADVTGFALPPETKPSLFAALGLAKRIRHVEGRRAGPAGTGEALQDIAAGIRLPHGGAGAGAASYQEPKGTFDTNVVGTVNVLEAARKRRARARGRHRHQRQMLREPRVGLGLSRERPDGRARPVQQPKGCAELVCAAYRGRFCAGERRAACASASARAGGQRHRRRGLGGGSASCPDSVRALSGETASSCASRGSVRPWQHVLEPLGGYMMLAAAC